MSGEKSRLTGQSCGRAWGFLRNPNSLARFLDSLEHLKERLNTLSINGRASDPGEQPRARESIPLSGPRTPPGRRAADTRGCQVTPAKAGKT